MTHPQIQPQQHPEPYRPDNLRDWKVGDKVAWRISSECPYKCGGCGFNCHWLGNTGEGFIDEINHSPTFTHFRDVRDGCGAISNTYSHDYCVIAEPDAATSYRGFWATASELIPIPEEGR